MSDWEDLGFVLSSTYRKAVILDLNKNGFNTPKDISLNTGLGMTHVSRALKELSDKGIVKCRNPESVKGRIYTLTEIGEKIASQLKDR